MATNYLSDGGVQLFSDRVEFFFHLKDLLVAVSDFVFSIGSLLFSSLELVLDLEYYFIYWKANYSIYLSKTFFSRYQFVFSCFLFLLESLEFFFCFGSFLLSCLLGLLSSLNNTMDILLRIMIKLPRIDQGRLPCRLWASASSSWSPPSSLVVINSLKYKPLIWRKYYFL